MLAREEVLRGGWGVRFSSSTLTSVVFLILPPAELSSLGCGSFKKCLFYRHITAFHVESPSWLFLLNLHLNVGAPQALAPSSTERLCLLTWF